MVALLKTYIDQLEFANEQIEFSILQLLYNNQNIIIDLNTTQLMNGINSVGESLGEYRSEKYAAFKRTLNPKGVVDLKLHGDFHSSFFVDKEDKFPVFVNASDSKTTKLVNDYGEEIFDLTEQNKDLLAHQYLKEEVQQLYRKLLLL